MNTLHLLSIVRRVEREAGRLGYSNDALIDDSMLPDTPTYNQQHDISEISLRAKVGDLSTRDRELVNQLIRNCIMGGPRRSPPQRTWRRKW